MNGQLISTLGGVVVLIGSAITIYGAYVSRQETTEKQEEIVSLAKRNAELSDEIKEYATGGDSYFYFHVEDFAKGEPCARIRHVGRAPVRDVVIETFDVTAQVESLAAGETLHYDLKTVQPLIRRLGVVYPHGNRELSDFPFVKDASDSFYAYFVLIYASSGTIRQQLQFELVDGEWQQAYVVDRIPDTGKAVPLAEHFDDRFPHQTTGRLNFRETEQGRRDHQQNITNK